MPRPFLPPALLLAAMAAPAGAQETLGGDPNITVSYYDVKASTPRAMVREIEGRKIAMLGGGKAAWGLTTAEFGYGWMIRGAGPLDCDLAQAKVTYKIKVLLPRVAPGVTLKKETADWWAASSAKLRHHEIDHVKLALGYAEKMQAAIRAATCTTAADEAKRVMAEFEQANAAYDGLTRHGTTVPARRKGRS
ncbi:MAG TPA: DUF922 domain-containing protein [Caulobacteraceae bacterium]|jgi:predicted secreted Zn-dependent protease